MQRGFIRGYWKLVLHKFGFSSEISSAIPALYTNPTAFVFTEGMFSDSFIKSNGTRQGCPLSPLLFALLMELVAEKNKISPKYIRHRLCPIISFYFPFCRRCDPFPLKSECVSTSSLYNNLYKVNYCPLNSSIQK